MGALLWAGAVVAISSGRLNKLEAVRGFAAVYVVLYHTVSLFFATRRGWAIPFLFGPEAVTVFFVLSGFVIYYSTVVNPVDLLIRNYAIKRVRRIYPIFIFALVLSYVSYLISARHIAMPDWKMLAGNLLMLQDFSSKPGVWVGTFYNNGPLWSLSYEWWFYVMFIVLVRMTRQRRLRLQCAWMISLIGIISYNVHPNQVAMFMMYFMIWWSGVELATEYIDTGKVTLGRQAVPWVGLVLLSIGWLVPVARAIDHHQHLIMNACPMLLTRHILAAVLLVPLAIAWQECRFAGFKYLVGPFSFFAPMSYAIYVIHYPIASALNSFSTGQYGAEKVILTFILTLALAYVLEERMQPIINRFSKRSLAASANRSRTVIQRDALVSADAGTGMGVQSLAARPSLGS
jgi:peptidoglycan/LPS O-acetylase OafA/YrhL